MTAAEPDSSGEIIIKGGSCEIEFAEGIFDLAHSSDRKRQTHKHEALKIHRIVITGNQSFDSGNIDDGFKGEIRIKYYKS